MWQRNARDGTVDGEGYECVAVVIAIERKKVPVIGLG